MALATTMKAWLRGLFGVYDSSSVDVEAMVSQLFKHSFVWEIPADANAGSNIATEYIWTAETACKLVGVALVPDGTATANATNYATLNVLSADGAGGSATAVASVATTVAGGGNIATGVPYDFTISTADLTAGQVLAFNAIKSGSGVDLPTGKLVVTVEEA